MSVAELKSQVAALSYEEMDELSLHLRGLVLSKNPARLVRLKAAVNGSQWVSQEEFEQAMDQLEKRGQ